MARVDIQVDALRAKAKVEAQQDRLNRDIILRRIGNEVHGWITDNIRSRGRLAGGWEPMAPNTRIQHRSPMIRTARMLRSFGFTTTANRVSIGSDSRVAEYQHFGTPPHRIQGNPFLRFPTTTGEVVTRAVQHPGTPARRLIPNRRQAKAIGVRVVEEQVHGAT